VSAVPELVKITVRASDAHPDVLTVQDAMRQVLDVFALLKSGAKDESGLEWNLLRASTNSPFQVDGEAVSLRPSVDITVVARAQKMSLARNLREVIHGKLPDDPDFEVRVVKGLMARNLNGIGATEIDLGIGETIIVTPVIARAAMQTIEKRSPSTLYDMPHPREEIGSIEGTLSTLGTHWNAPAVRVHDYRTKSLVWCRLSAQLQKEFDGKTTFDDVWRHRRVRVRGRIKYDLDGGIDYVLATDILKQEERAAVPIERLRDPDFTGGLSIGEYLDRFRDGALG
jgi:hypothetical protein